jgi:uncharacterized RDD family membrane protein YckC
MECPRCHNQVTTRAKNCKRCGGAIPSSQHLLEECGLTDPVPGAASTKPSTPSPARTANRYRFARLGDRFLAFALDIALLFGMFAILDAWVFMRWGVFDGTELQLTIASLVIVVTVNAAVLFLYGWLLEAACGATLGKVLVGIRVVRTRECSALSACALRNLLKIIDGLGCYMVGAAVAACSEVRQRIGDICAHTAVIEDRFGIAARVCAIVLWVATVAGAVWTVPTVCSTTHPIPTRYLSQVVVRIGIKGNSAYLRVGDLTLDVHS